MSSSDPLPNESLPNGAPPYGAPRVEKSDADWLRELTREQYRITRRKGTEPPFTGAYWNTTAPGAYHCVCCGLALFASDDKFDSRTGWPSFTRAVDDHVQEREDRSFFMRRIEVVCAGCDAHLGHLFDDGPPPTHRRYCINSVALAFRPRP